MFRQFWMWLLRIWSTNESDEAIEVDEENIVDEGSSVDEAIVVSEGQAKDETGDNDEPNSGNEVEGLPVGKHKEDQEHSHSHLINENRVYLVEHIDLNNTLILDQLTQDGILSTTQLDAIKQENSINHQRVSALLDVIIKKPHEDWIHFMKCLKRHHHEYVVNKINRENKGRITGTKRLQFLLAETVLKFYNKIDVWSWYDRHVTVPMDEVYVELVWIRTKDGVHSRRHHRLANYTEVFSEVTPGQRGHLIFLFGEPGVGKSTISRRMCVDWSNIILDKKTTMTTEQREVLSKFKYVVPIILRDIKKNQALVDVIKEQLKLEMTDAEELCELIKHNQPSTLFVLDGYDEYRDTTSDDITRLAHREHFPYAHIFITSRHSSGSHFNKKTDVPETEVSLRGFSPEGITEYVQKSFQDGETSEEGERLLEKIKQSDDLTHLSRYPAVLLLMCCLWEETKQLANTFGGFYEDFIKYSCCRFEKSNIDTEMWNTLEAILGVYHDCLMEIGEIATGGMMGDRLELTFKYKQVRDAISEKAWKLGFLREEISPRGQRLVSFVHKTVQEWFVAFFIVNCDESKQNELLLHFCGSPQAFRESAMLITFVSGLGGRDIKEQIENIISGDKDNMAEMYTSLQISYLSEHREADLVLPEVMELHITDKYPAQVYVKYLSMNADKLNKLSLWSPDERHLRLLQHLNAPSLTWLRLYVWSSGSPCSVDESYMTQELDLTLTNFPIRTLKLSGFNRETRSGRRLIDDGGDDDDDDTSPDLLAVIRAVRHIKTLHHLKFEGTPLTMMSVNSLTECLPDTHLITLTLRICFLTSQKFWSVLDKLPDCHKLINLDVQDNRLDDNMEDLVNRTEKLSGLSTLDLSDNRKISDRVREKIKQTLTIKCPDLKLEIKQHFNLPQTAMTELFKS